MCFLGLVCAPQIIVIILVVVLLFIGKNPGTNERNRERSKRI